MVRGSVCTSDSAARLAHLTGHVPRELARHAFTLIGGVPSMELANVLAETIGDATRTTVDLELAAAQG